MKRIIFYIFGNELPSEGTCKQLRAGGDDLDLGGSGTGQGPWVGTPIDDATTIHYYHSCIIWTYTCEKEQKS